MVDPYQQEGLLDKKLLWVLWHRHGFQKAKDIDAFRELIIAFHLCYPVSEQSNLLFLPWFVESRDCPNEVDPRQISKFTRKQMSVQFKCCFVPCIPMNVFESLIVELQRAAIEKGYTGERYAWKHGLLVKFETLQTVVVRKEEEHEILCCVLGDVCDVTVIWDISHQMCNDLSTTLDQYDGLNAEIMYLCGHCILTGRPQIKCVKYKEVLPNNNPITTYVECCGATDIPWALVRAFPGNISEIHTLFL